MSDVRSAFICDGIRTPFGRYGGILAGFRADDLAAIPLAALLARNAGVDPAAIDEVVLGCANQAGEDNRNVARMALLLAGLPLEIPGVTVNRLCASGLDSVAYAARSIASGQADLVMAGGVESMTRAPFVMGKADTAYSRAEKLEDTTIGWRLVNPKMQARYGVDSMPQTGENVAQLFGVSRRDQDWFALRSQQRTASAIERGYFIDEIVPVELKGLRGSVASVSSDEHPRPETSLEGLSKLKPVVTPTGSVTAGNAAGVNDGAAALLIASEDAVRQHRLKPWARISAYASAGVAPRIMGIGPVPAVKRVSERTGLKVSDFGHVELNEAFASQALAVLRQLGIADDAPHVNPNGGAIALGHPLGASGARLCLTAARALAQSRQKYTLITMCVGVGQGVAMVLEAV